MGLELVLDERAAVGKAALADGAVEGQRGGWTLTAVAMRCLSISELGSAFTCRNRRTTSNLLNEGNMLYVSL